MYRFCNFLLCCFVVVQTHNHHINLFRPKSKERTKQNTIYLLLSTTVSSWSNLHSTALPPRIKHGRRRKDLLRWLCSPHSFSDLRSTLDRWAAVVPLLPVVVWTLPWCRPTPSSRWCREPKTAIMTAVSVRNVIPPRRRPVERENPSAITPLSLAPYRPRKSPCQSQCIDANRATDGVSSFKYEEWPWKYKDTIYDRTICRP